MNVFQADYDARLRDWKDLRLTIRQIPLDQVCVKVDAWWQQAPLVNHHLHYADVETWPDPWSLLSENIYCTLTRAIGICYTLLMSDIYDIQLVMATDSQCEEYNLVLVGKPKYVINYWPDTVLSTTLNDFTIIRQLSLEQLKQKIK